jgi:hypothetical protein
MQDKAQQGNHDSMPTPERELERYGVWVKAEPQDVIEDASPEGQMLDSVSSDAMDSMTLSSEEEALLESFDMPEENDKALAESAEIDDFDILEPMDDRDAPGGDAESELQESIEFDENELEGSIIDVPVDDLDFEESTAAQLHEETPVNMESAGSSGFSTVEVSMDDFDFEDSSSDSPSLEAIGSIDPSPAKSGTDTSIEDKKADFDSLDIDLQFDDTIPSGADSEIYMEENEDLILETSSDFETVDIDSMGLESSSSDTTTLPDIAPDETTDIPADNSIEEISVDSFIDSDESEPGVMPEMAMEDVTIDAGDYAPATDTASSSDLLQKIALELSSIKEELVSLRSQLSSLKAGTEPRPEAKLPISTQDEEAAAGGFFDDEDDDTIALTGDELDNILNTADFTEEAAADESLPEEESLDISIPADIDILPEDGVYATSVPPGIETIEDDTESSDNDSVLELNPEEGVTPMVNQPLDTSFLDSDVPSEDLDLSPMDDVALIEPNTEDLELIMDSAFGKDDEELPLMEPPIDEVELETLEPEPEELESEIVLEMQGDAEPVVSTVDSFVESVDEIEDLEELEDITAEENLGGVELHVEEVALESSTEDVSDFDSTLEPQPEEEVIPDLSPNFSSYTQQHPDDLSTSLDDSLFVESSREQAAEPLPETVEMTSPDAIEQEQVGAPTPEPAPAEPPAEVPDKLKHDVKSVLLYLDQLLASLPDEKIEEFASSEYYDTYKRLFDDLGLL